MKVALRLLGADVTSIPSRPDRSPMWPTGFVGSLSHCQGFCAAVVARDTDAVALGLDVEAAAALQPSLAGLVCNPQDFPHKWSASLVRRHSWRTIAFSAKEAALKCGLGAPESKIDISKPTVHFSQENNHNMGDFCMTFSDTRVENRNSIKIDGRWKVFNNLVLASVWKTSSQSADDA